LELTLNEAADIKSKVILNLKKEGKKQWKEKFSETKQGCWCIVKVADTLTGFGLIPKV
jgi:uncharacterized protein YdeI (YjbR/CyaY-like superfamily)